MSNHIRRKFFEHMWEMHPRADAKTVGWGSKDAQEDRFRYLTKVGDLSGAEILDVGCGLGDLYEYLCVNSLVPKRYVGIDMMRESIDEASRKNEELFHDAEFICGDFLDQSFENFDYVIASGIFSIKTNDWWPHMIKTVKKMLGISRIGVAINFLSELHPNKIDGSMYVHPATVLSALIREVTPWVNLYHDYRTNDFTTCLYKERKTR